MLETPAALELCLLWEAFSFVGEVPSRPWTAESTLVRGSAMVIDKMDDIYRYRI